VTDGARLEPSVLHVAPSDEQLVMAQGGVMRIIADRDSSRRRFADTLLRSAATVFGTRLIAVVLSGRLDGGADGARAVKRHGGRVLVQDPQTAVAPSMPRAALATGCVDFALAPEALGQALIALCAAEGAAELFRVRLNTGVQG
jgi:two-component system chemotaxis response regulator CheB